MWREAEQQLTLGVCYDMQALYCLLDSCLPYCSHALVGVVLCMTVTLSLSLPGLAHVHKDSKNRHIDTAVDYAANRPQGRHGAAISAWLARFCAVCQLQHRWLALVAAACSVHARLVVNLFSCSYGALGRINGVKTSWRRAWLLEWLLGG